MLRRFAFAALLVSARLAPAADGPVPDFAPPGTRAVIGLHLRSVIDSSLVKSLGADMLKNAGAWNASSSLPGIDPLKDIDDVVVTTTMEGDHPPSLVICRGRFRGEEIGKGAVMYHGVPIRTVKDGDAVALLDPGTILAGAVKDVRAAIDRRESQATGRSGELATRAAELSERYAIWGVGSLPADFHPPAGGPDGLNSLDRFDFGIALTQGLELAATLHVRKAEDAQKLSAAMQFVQMMSKSQPDNGTKLETHVENGTLTVSLAVTQDALRKAIQQQGAMIAQAFANGMAQGQRTRAQAKATAPASPAVPAPAASAPHSAPVLKETKIISDDEGASVKVTLPGKR